MFDNPRRELERLQNELLAAQEEPEAEYDGDMDADEALADIRRMLAREDWEEDQREPLYRSYVDEEESGPEGPWIPDPPRKKRRQVPQQSEEPQDPPRRKPRYGFLLGVLLLETVALAVMALWWWLWLR